MEWPLFYSVVAVSRSAAPFTLKATEFSVSALQLSQHCYNLYFCTYIPLLFFTVYCLLQNLTVLVRIFHVNCMNQQDRRELFPCGVTLHSDWPRTNHWIASIAQRCVQVAILPLILECYCSTLDHYRVICWYVWLPLPIIYTIMPFSERYHHLRK